MPYFIISTLIYPIISGAHLPQLWAFKNAQLGRGEESVLTVFAPVFRKTTWGRARLLVVGAILCQGPRTVCSVLRVMGLASNPRFEGYHRVLNRAKIKKQYYLSAGYWSEILLIRRRLKIFSAPI